MLSNRVFAILMVISLLGLMLGFYYYIRPEKIVYKRLKRHHWEAAQKDSEVMDLLSLELEGQVLRTRRMGMVIVILEAVWMVVILSLWVKGLRR